MAKLDPRQISDQLLRLVQVFFGFVFAQSLLALKPVILRPYEREYWVAAIAPCSVFYTAVSSWIDWHITMAYSPYGTDSMSERMRMYFDLGIATIYAYLL